MRPKKFKMSSFRSPILSKDSTVIGNFDSIERLRTVAEAIAESKNNLKRPTDQTDYRDGELINRKSMDSIIQAKYSNDDPGDDQDDVSDEHH